MSTFLELTKDLARESGTLSPDQMTAVTGQSGRPLKMVEWVNEAWLRIQRKRRDWFWMRAETTKTLTAGTARYAGGSAPWSITRFGEFIDDTDDLQPFSLYVTATGESDEHVLGQISYEAWYEKYARGPGLLTANRHRPIEYAISPAGEVCFGPVPDASTYTVRLIYQKSPQTLSADGDIPELPTHYHDLIVWEAKRLLLLHDKAFTSAQQ